MYTLFLKFLAGAEPFYLVNLEINPVIVITLYIYATDYGHPMKA